MSTIASHSPLTISETVRDRESWFQRTTNRKWPMGYQGHVTNDVTWPETERSNLWPQYAYEANISKTAGDAGAGATPPGGHAPV